MLARRPPEPLQRQPCDLDLLFEGEDIVPYIIQLSAGAIQRRLESARIDLEQKIARLNEGEPTDRIEHVECKLEFDRRG